VLYAAHMLEVSTRHFSASQAQSSGARKPKRTEEETATGNKLQLHPPRFKVSDEMGQGHRLPRASPELGRTSSSVSTNTWKTAPATMTDEELEALLEEDSAETLSFEAMLDKLVLSKDPISRTLQWAMTLPPTLALFVAHASPPHAIVVANKKWQDLTGLPDPTHGNLDVLQGPLINTCWPRFLGRRKRYVREWRRVPCALDE